ncbi:hypothetical protein ACLOJK_039498 [Asimina triloba]
MGWFAGPVGGPDSRAHSPSSDTFREEENKDSMVQKQVEFIEERVVVVERLPSGAFADPFELQHLVQRSVFADVSVFGDANLELPSALSNQSVVEVHMNVSHKFQTKYENDLMMSIDLPLHARYPPLDACGSGYSRVEMGLPNLFLHCKREEAEHEDCLWTSITWNTEFTGNEDTIWYIPCGNPAHAGIVTIVTFLSATEGEKKRERRGERMCTWIASCLFECCCWPFRCCAMLVKWFIGLFGSLDSLAELRNGILVVATLIATLSFQAVITPPGGLDQAEGKAVWLEKHPSRYRGFLVLDTLAFLLSVSAIITTLLGLLPGTIVQGISVVFTAFNLLFAMLSMTLAFFICIR